MHDTATAQAPATGWVAATRSLWLASALFGTVSNLLVLTGPMFMLLVYDRVLPGRSEPTLMVLFALVLFLYAMMAGIDTARARIMARIGARSRHHLEARVLEASLRARRRDPPDPRAALALHDLDAVQRVLGSNAAQALLDLPFTLLFLVLLFFVHPLLGWLALGGGTVLSALAFLGHLQQREALGTARHAGKAADLLHGAIEAEGGDRVAALSPALVERWQSHRAQALGALLAATDRSVRSTALARAFRLALQSASLGPGPGWCCAANCRRG